MFDVEKRNHGEENVEMGVQCTTYRGDCGALCQPAQGTGTSGGKEASSSSSEGEHLRGRAVQGWRSRQLRGCAPQPGRPPVSRTVGDSSMGLAEG